MKFVDVPTTPSLGCLRNSFICRIFAEKNNIIMGTTLERKSRTQRINYYVSTLKRNQPEVLENGLKTMYLRAMAQKLDHSVVADNNITMQEITDEVNAARQQRYEK
ncbi:MAG: hypothetical protein LBT25_03115 [Candidatus Symbiothrix sp.]|jgi:hypothetical protein|nr:hypothetical protein [Candidatus Symbiothrix sp.]